MSCQANLQAAAPPMLLKIGTIPRGGAPLLRVHRSSPVGMTSSIWDHSTALVAEYREDASSPVSDLFQSPIAIAYLGVLAVLFGFLAYLALASQRAKTRRLESYDEMERVSESLMREGK